MHSSKGCEEVLEELNIAVLMARKYFTWQPLWQGSISHGSHSGKENCTLVEVPGAHRQRGSIVEVIHMATIQARKCYTLEEVPWGPQAARK